jgi:hypothetical protein
MRFGEEGCQRIATVNYDLSIEVSILPPYIRYFLLQKFATRKKKNGGKKIKQQETFV